MLRFLPFHLHLVFPSGTASHYLHCTIPLQSHFQAVGGLGRPKAWRRPRHSVPLSGCLLAWVRHSVMKWPHTFPTTTKTSGQRLLLSSCADEDVGMVVSKFTFKSGCPHGPKCTKGSFHQQSFKSHIPDCNVVWFWSFQSEGRDKSSECKIFTAHCIAMHWPPRHQNQSVVKPPT